MKLPQKENVDYLTGKLDGLEMMMNIVNMIDVDNHSIRWLVREMESLRDKLNNMEEEE